MEAHSGRDNCDVFISLFASFSTSTRHARHDQNTAVSFEKSFQLESQLGNALPLTNILPGPKYVWKSFVLYFQKSTSQRALLATELVAFTIKFAKSS